MLDLLGSHPVRPFRTVLRARRPTQVFNVEDRNGMAFHFDGDISGYLALKGPHNAMRL